MCENENIPLEKQESLKEKTNLLIKSLYINLFITFSDETSHDQAVLSIYLSLISLDNLVEYFFDGVQKGRVLLSQNGKKD